MRLLLDTHVVIWWDLGAPLSDAAHQAIMSADEVCVSAVSEWEVAIKAGLGKIRSTRYIETVVHENGFTELPVLMRHAAGMRALPSLHRDPFDRLLVSQALAEGLQIITRDESVIAYSVPSIRA
jgi:PIN domain nuclease of toxin-antitoxin system